MQNSFSDDMFQSKWHYAKEIVNRETVTGTTTGFRNYNFKETDERTRVSSALSNLLYSDRKIKGHQTWCDFFHAVCSFRDF